MDVAKILPLAFVMVAGPQIISAFFFATSESWKKVSAAYVLGAAASITAVVTAAYFVVKGAGGGGDDGDSGSDAVDYAILALLLFAMVHTFRGRNQSEPPKWMGKLQTAQPKMTLVLGFLLLGFFPSDLITSISVGSFLANHSDPWWHGLPFVALTLLFLATPALLVAAMGSRAQIFLPKVRDWMNANSWIVSEVVLALFVVIVLSG